jgi:hypothetical protein
MTVRKIGLARNAPSKRPGKAGVSDSLGARGYALSLAFPHLPPVIFGGYRDCRADRRSERSIRALGMPRSFRGFL